MKKMILASAAVLSLAIAGTAAADKPQVKFPELAASGIPQNHTDARASNYAVNGLPQQATDETRLAAGGGWHPTAGTDQHGIQLAASGLGYVHRSHGAA